MLISKYLQYLVIGIVFFLTYLITSIIFDEPVVELETTEAKDFFLVINDTNYTVVDKQGLKAQGHFKSIRSYYPDFNEFLIDSPEMVLYSEGKENLSLHSAKGNFNNSEQSFTFEDDFRAETIGGSEQPIVITANSASYQRQDNKLIIKDHIKVDGKNYELIADEIIYYMD